MINRFFAFLFCCFLTPLALAQSTLDDIHLDLPKQYQWQKKTDLIRMQGTRRMQIWVSKNKSENLHPNAVIISIAKQAMPYSFKKTIKKRLQASKNQQADLLEQGYTSDGFAYALFKVSEATQQNSPALSCALIYILSDNSFHAASIRIEQAQLNDRQIAQWSGLLKNAVITVKR